MECLSLLLITNYCKYLPVLFLAFCSSIFSQVKFQKFESGRENLDAVVRIGVVVEQAAKGTISLETREYFKVLKKTVILGNKLIGITPVPLNAFVRSRIKFNQLSNVEKIAFITSLVEEDLKNVNAVVIPGDDFNFPAMRANQDPLTELLNYQGTKENHDEETIYGMTAREFNKFFPNHHLNPYPDSLLYEAILIKALSGTSMPILSACHGTMMFGFLRGARFRAGIKGHLNHNTRNTKTLPGSKAARMLGSFDTMTKHYHGMAMLKKNFPKSLIVSGWEGELVEILEDPQNPYYIGFQGHPELTPEHPALNFLIQNAIRMAERGLLLSEAFSHSK